MWTTPVPESVVTKSAATTRQATGSAPPATSGAVVGGPAGRKVSNGGR